MTDDTSDSRHGGYDRKSNWKSYISQENVTGNTSGIRHGSYNRKSTWRSYISQENVTGNTSDSQYCGYNRKWAWASCRCGYPDSRKAGCTRRVPQTINKQQVTKHPVYNLTISMQDVHITNCHAGCTHHWAYIQQETMTDDTSDSRHGGYDRKSTWKSYISQEVWQMTRQTIDMEITIKRLPERVTYHRRP